MGRRAIATCAVIGLVAIGAGLSAAIRPVPDRGGGDDDRNLLVLQRIAETSCKCERRAGPDGKAACWAAFDRLMPPPERGGTDMISACAPISTQGRCGRDNAKNDDDPMAIGGPCVTMRYEYGDMLLCSADEAALVERAWNKEAEGQESIIRTPIADQIARDLIAGRKPKPLAGPGGCVSG